MPDTSYASFLKALREDCVASLSDDFARDILDETSGALDLVERADGSMDAAQMLALSQLGDYCCTHGDAMFQRDALTRGWHTLGLSVLLRAGHDHVLCEFSQCKQLRASLADALGLDYASLHVGPYVLHAKTALGASLPDIAKYCATMRLQACGDENLRDMSYGLNFAGTRAVHLAMQAQLFVSVRASSKEDARAMAQELMGWVSAKTRTVAVQFRTPLDELLEVECIPMMAGLPWSLRVEAAYEIHALLFKELARNWAHQEWSCDARELHFCIVPQPGAEQPLSQLALLVWHPSRPGRVMAAAQRADAMGELLDAKLMRYLADMGLRYRELEPATALPGEVLFKDGSRGSVAWDPRFPLRLGT